CRRCPTALATRSYPNSRKSAEGNRDACFTRDYDRRRHHPNPDGGNLSRESREIRGTASPSARRAGLGEPAIGNVRRQIRGLWHRYVRRRSGTVAQSSLDRHHDRYPGRRLHCHCRLSGRRCRVTQTVPGGRAAIAVDRTPRVGPHAGSRRAHRIVAARVGNRGWGHLMRTADQAVEKTSPLSWRFVTPQFAGSALNPINSSLIATALVPIAAALHVSVGRTAVLVSALYLATAIAQPTGGKLAEEFGARRVFMTGLWIVVAGGLVGGTGQDLTALVVARVL